MTIKNEELMVAIQELTRQHKDAFVSMESRVTLIETGILTIHKDLSKVETKMDGLMEHSIIATKDIDYLKENLCKLERTVKEDFDNVWEKGIRGTKISILDAVTDKIDKRALHERLTIYGAAIAAIFAVVKVLK